MKGKELKGNNENTRHKECGTYKGLKGRKHCKGCWKIAISDFTDTKCEHV